MTDKMAWDKAQNNEIVFCVFCAMGTFYVASCYITQMRVEHNAVVRYLVEGDSCIDRGEYPAEQIFETAEEADKLRDQMQHKYGRVSISQMEYDEYMRLKAAAN